MKTHLDFVFDNERMLAARPWLTQPMGGGVLRTWTWAEGMGEVRRMAAHLQGLGLPPGSSIAIFSKNTAWWWMADLAIWAAGHVTVPVYPTLTSRSIRQILDHADARAVFVGKLDGFAGMEAGLGDTPRIATPLAPTMDAAVPRWDDIVQKTAALEGTPQRDPDELATIIYTSGSTGEPKGVRHSFRTMCAALAFADAIGVGVDDRVISYLPLAHVAERSLMETGALRAGSQIFFAETLESFVDDVRRARPTIFGSVPRLWLKMQSGVNAKMPEEKLARLLKLPVIGGIVKRKVLDGLGLRHVRMAFTGSAPTPPEIIQYFGRLGIVLHDIYGMTENFAISHLARGGEVKPGWVGTPLPGVTCRIADDGEVLVKSPGTMLGYHKNDALTQSLLDADGFLHTGDRGEVDAQGRLKITGRVKELFKTSKGKYVAPAPIENRLLAHAMVEQACVTGASLAQPFALVVLAEHLRGGRTPRETVLRALTDHVEALNRDLDQHERLEKVIVVAEEWTVENGLLTPTMKLKRSAVEERYAAMAPEWYARTERILWA